MKVLIIEDEVQLVKSMALALRQEGYVCDVALKAMKTDKKVSMI